MSMRVAMAFLVSVSGNLITSADAPGWLEKDKRELASLMEGRWDNERHGFFAGDADLDASILAPRRHTLIRKPGDGDGSDGFEFELENDAVRSSFRLEIEDLSETIVQTYAASDCRIDWRRDAGQFRGQSAGDCDGEFDVPEGDGPADVKLSLSPTEFWVVAERDGERLETRYRRARMFSCWVAILRGAQHGDSGEGMDDWQFLSGVTLHDQGGEARVVSDEEVPRTVRLKLRDAEWTYGSNRASLVLYVHENDSERATSYAWTSTGADRIGVNLRWLQSSCTREADLDLVSNDAKEE